MFWYGNISKVRTQLSSFQVNHATPKNIGYFMHFRLMCFFMPDIPSPLPLEKKNLKTLPSLHLLHYAKARKPHLLFSLTSPIPNLSLSSSQPQKPKSRETLTTLFPKKSWNPKNLWNPSPEFLHFPNPIFFSQPHGTDPRSWETLVALFFFLWSFKP